MANWRGRREDLQEAGGRPTVLRPSVNRRGCGAVLEMACLAQGPLGEGGVAGGVKVDVAKKRGSSSGRVKCSCFDGSRPAWCGYVITRSAMTSLVASCGRGVPLPHPPGVTLGIGKIGLALRDHRGVVGYHVGGEGEDVSLTPWLLRLCFELDDDLGAVGRRFAGAAPQFGRDEV